MNAGRWARRAEGPAYSIAVMLVAIALGFGVAALFIGASGASVSAAFDAIWDGAFGSRPQYANTIQKTIPILLVALGWIVAFTARRINIGLEGQVLLGALASTAVGLWVDLPRPVLLPLATLGRRRRRRGLGRDRRLAVGLAQRQRDHLDAAPQSHRGAVRRVGVREPIAGDRADVIRTNPVADGARWPVLLERTPLTWAIVLVVIAVAFVAVLGRFTVFGFRARFSGVNERAARSSGVHTTRISVVSLLLSGALAGVAGSVLVLASQSHALTDNVSDGIGFTGIVAALLGANSAILAVPASLLLAALAQGRGAHGSPHRRFGRRDRCPAGERDPLRGCECVVHGPTPQPAGRIGRVGGEPREPAPKPSVEPVTPEGAVL